MIGSPYYFLWKKLFYRQISLHKGQGTIDIGPAECAKRLNNGISKKFLGISKKVRGNSKTFLGICWTDGTDGRL